MGLLNFFTKKPGPAINFLTVDMHSHLLPGIDDGAETIEDSIELIKSLKDNGYSKLITTPHVMGDFYKNTPEIIKAKLEEVRKAVKEEGIEIEIDAAAEYYLDEWFISNLEKGNEILTFGNKYVLFETSFLNEPANLKEAIFLISSNGYKPVFAHPERYVYLYSSFEKYEELFERGLYFQININSLSGYYSKAAKKIAEKLIEKEMVHFVGTDCHGLRHIDAFRNSLCERSYQDLQSLNLLNNSLL